jgi:thiol-disulfide isomerase/thioredoxin
VAARYGALSEEGLGHLVRRDPERAAASFEEMERLVPSSAEGPYLLAGALSVKGDQEAATRALARAILSGFDDARRLEFDPAFRALREDPRFRVMILAAEANARSLEEDTAAGALPRDLPGFETLEEAQRWGRELRRRAERWSAVQSLGEFRRLRWRALDAHRGALERHARGLKGSERARVELAAAEILAEYRDPPRGWELGEARRRLRTLAKTQKEASLLARTRWLELHLSRRALPGVDPPEERERLGRELASKLDAFIAAEEEAGRGETAGLALFDRMALEAALPGGDPGPHFARLSEGYAESEELWSFAREREAALMLALAGVPPFEATDLGGEPRGSEDLAGKVVLIDFWATWCPPCVEQIPELAALHRQLAGDERFLVLGVSLDAGEDMDAESFDAWLARQGVIWPQIRDGQGDLSPLARAFGVEAVPFQVLVGPDGSVVEAGPRVPLHRIRELLEANP